MGKRNHNTKRNVIWGCVCIIGVVLGLLWNGYAGALVISLMTFMCAPKARSVRTEICLLLFLVVLYFTFCCFKTCFL